MSDRRRHIAIDGPAASGKSTLGKALADALGVRYLDTGQMYRAVTHKALCDRVLPGDEETLQRIAGHTRFELHDLGLRVDGAAVGAELHSPEVDAAVSEVSAHPGVRSVLVARQREMADDGPIVMVGRDIGTIVLPDALVKLWLTASEDERVRRRLRDQSDDIAREGQVAARARLGSRDRLDTNRAHSPLRQATDAIVVNTDGQSPEQVLDQALAAVRATYGDGPS